jgi:hypothetical protein
MILLYAILPSQSSSSSNSILLELAVMETRYHSRNPLRGFHIRDVSRTDSRRKHYNSLFSLRG